MQKYYYNIYNKTSEIIQLLNLKRKRGMGFVENLGRLADYFLCHYKVFFAK